MPFLLENKNFDLDITTVQFVNFKFCSLYSVQGWLGHGQTPCFTWAESNANEKKPLFSLIKLHWHSIRLTCEVRRLTPALGSFSNDDGNVEDDARKKWIYILSSSAAAE